MPAHFEIILERGDTLLMKLRLDRPPADAVSFGGERLR